MASVKPSPDVLALAQNVPSLNMAIAYRLAQADAICRGIQARKLREAHTTPHEIGKQEK